MIVHNFAGCHLFERDAVGAAWESARRRRNRVVRLEVSRVDKSAPMDDFRKKFCHVKGTHFHGWVVTEKDSKQ